MDDADAERAISKQVTSDGHDDDFGDEFEVRFWSDIHQADENDNDMIDNVVNADPQKVPVAEVTEESKFIPHHTLSRCITMSILSQQQPEPSRNDWQRISWSLKFNSDERSHPLSNESSW